MKVRVFENPDGSVRIMRLNEKMRLSVRPSGVLDSSGDPIILPAETDDEFAGRMFPIEQAKDATLSSLASSDMDDVDIPASRADRKDWKRRIRNGKMRVEVVKV